MEVVNVGTTAEGFSVYLDRHAAEADHIGIVARVKPHTGFQGPIESGLMKMMLTGLGKHIGALLTIASCSIIRLIGWSVPLAGRCWPGHPSASGWPWWKTLTRKRRWLRRYCRRLSRRGKSTC